MCLTSDKSLLKLTKTSHFPWKCSLQMSGLLVTRTSISTASLVSAHVHLNLLLMQARTRVPSMTIAFSWSYMKNSTALETLLGIWTTHWRMAQLITLEQVFLCSTLDKTTFRQWRNWTMTLSNCTIWTIYFRWVQTTSQSLMFPIRTTSIVDRLLHLLSSRTP